MFFQSTVSQTQRTEHAIVRDQPAPGGIPLKAECVSKTFSGGAGSIEALRPVDLDVAAGEFVCLLGPSGCGKSTLLSIIASLETASSGSALSDRLKGPCPVTDC